MISIEYMGNTDGRQKLNNHKYKRSRVARKACVA